MAKPPSKPRRRSAPPSTDEELVEDLDEANEIIPFTYSITSYGADYPVDSIVKRIKNEEIVVPKFGEQPSANSNFVGFQREYVWDRAKADKFIESLLLGLPVPGVFLVKEPDGIFLVLDGHQRLHTLYSFYEGVIGGVEYRLGNVQDRYKNKKYTDLDSEDRRRIDNSIIHSTIIRQDEPSEDQSSIYVIFERLNTGGVNLQPQEIRVALYNGEFVKVLSDLNDDENWRELFGKKSKRLKDMELILRFFAFLYYQDSYRAPMKDFLNRYMASNRHLDKQSKTDLEEIFSKTTKIILDTIGTSAFRPQRAVNAAVLDSLMVGVATRLLKKSSIRSTSKFKDAYENLLTTRAYLEAIETGTSQEANVANRFKLAREAFQKVG